MRYCQKIYCYFTEIYEHKHRGYKHGMTKFYNNQLQQMEIYRIYVSEFPYFEVICRTFWKQTSIFCTRCILYYSGKEALKLILWSDILKWQCLYLGDTHTTRWFVRDWYMRCVLSEVYYFTYFTSKSETGSGWTTNWPQNGNWFYLARNYHVLQRRSQLTAFFVKIMAIWMSLVLEWRAIHQRKIAVGTAIIYFANDS